MSNKHDLHFRENAGPGGIHSFIAGQDVQKGADAIQKQ